MLNYKPGDKVIYRKAKTSSHPTPRARDVHPAQHGELYSYAVDKYWVVTRQLDDRHIEVMTRNGKLHELDADDRRLKKANLLERALYGGRFPHIPVAGRAD